MIGLLLTIFTVMQLNCENLFDCSHDSLKDDMQFTPSSPRHYNASTYWQRLNKITKEISWCGCVGEQLHLPDIITLCEVENDTVLTYLTERSALRTARYRYLMTESPDVRGIDVAILYNPRNFRLISHHSIRIKPIKGMRPTRDILYASGMLRHGDTLHLFAVHMPSRYGGSKVTEPYRAHVAESLRSAIDSIITVNPKANIIVAGDFNAGKEESDILMQGMLDNVSADACGAYGAMATYRYNGLWQSIDHIYISKVLKKNFRRCVIKDAPFLLEKDTKYGGVKPRRFWNGMRKNGGYSDHLPLLAEFSF